MRVWVTNLQLLEVYMLSHLLVNIRTYLGLDCRKYFYIAYGKDSKKLSIAWNYLKNENKDWWLGAINVSQSLQTPGFRLGRNKGLNIRNSKFFIQFWIVIQNEWTKHVCKSYVYFIYELWPKYNNCFIWFDERHFFLCTRSPRMLANYRSVHPFV